MLSALYIYLVISILGDRFYKSLHFTDKKTEAENLNVLLGVTQTVGLKLKTQAGLSLYLCLTSMRYGSFTSEEAPGHRRSSVSLLGTL